MSRSDALKAASEAGLDLVEISPNANPPVAKIVDWGKYQYQKMKEAQKNRRSNKANELKQMRFGMKIGQGDLDYRIPVEQGIGAFTALQANNVPSQFLRFPDENHWVLKPRNSMQWHATVFGWLQKYIGTPTQ